MAMTLRLPGALEAEAAAYAESLGLSFTGLVAVALREYLDARPAPKAAVLAPAALPAAPGGSVAGPGAGGGPAITAAGGRSPSGRAAPEGSPAKLSPAERLLQKAQAKRAAGGEP